MNSDVAVTFRHYGTHQSGQVARDASTSSRDRVIALSLLATMVVAAVCCVVLLSPAHQTALESDQDSINDLLNKIDKLTASQSASPSAPAPAHAAARLAQHAPAQHLRLNVESPEQKFLDEVNSLPTSLFVLASLHFRQRVTRISGERYCQGRGVAQH